MQLTRGVSITADDASRSLLSQCLEVNSGTASARTLAGYAGEAIVPKGDWRPPTAEESGLLLGTEPTDAAASVALVSASPEIMRLAPAAVIESAQLDHGSHSMVVRQGGAATSALLAALGRFAAARGDIAQEPCLLMGAPNRLTVAFGNSGLLGLHVDEWFDTLPVPRDARPGRIVFNLGKQARYLVFVNLPVTAMPKMINDGLSSPEIDGTHLGRRFMRAFPHYPVCRLRVDPGYAYIAPTENLVHDGSLAATTERDIAGHVLGTFNPDPAVREV